jgi:hypothetical protein
VTEGLRPRPAVPPDVLQAITEAAELVVREARATTRRAPAWRFSGRWFSAHPIRTRSRPG